jgi:methanethiol S-methyltransferase
MSTLIILWLSFGISHSFLAATQVRAFFEKSINYYRIIYNLISLFLLLLISIYSIDIHSHILLINHFLIKRIAALLVISGLFVLFGVAKQMDLYEFFGFGKEDNNGTLITSGWYKIVRHPLYFGLFLVFFGIFLTIPTMKMFISFIFSQLYIIIGIEFEEKKLRRVFGQDYIDFSIGKKKFIPFIY